MNDKSSSVWFKIDDDHMVKVGETDLDHTQFVKMMEPHLIRPGRPGKDIVVIAVDVQELAKHIGPDAAEEFANTMPSFGSAAALSRALGFSGNAVHYALEKSQDELRGVRFCIYSD